MKVVLVSGSGCGVGTSAVVLGILSALKRRGLRVQPFYVGIGLKNSELYEVASGRRCVILDSQILNKQYCLRSLASRRSDTDVAIVEGLGGLLDEDQGGSATIAKWLDTPIVLVLDGRHGSGMSCAATVKGFCDFDAQLKIKGAILNRMSNEMQLEGMRKGLRSVSGQIAVLGGIPDQMMNGFHGARYCDLLLNNNGDKTAVECIVDCFRELICSHLDVDALLKVSTVLDCDGNNLPFKNISSASSDVRIAIARDEAFDSSIEDNLMLMGINGSQLVSFSPLRDVTLPPGIQALYLSANMLGQYSQNLAANRQLQIVIKAFAEGGGIVYAEGGGLAYLCRQLEPQCDMPCRMVGILPFRARLCNLYDVPRAYVEVATQQNCTLFPQNQSAKGSVQQQCSIVEERILGTFSSPRTASSEIPQSYSTCFVVNTNHVDESSINEGYCIGDNILCTQVLINFMSNPQFAASLVQRCLSVDRERVQQRVVSALQAYENEVLHWEQQYQQQLAYKLCPSVSVPNFVEPKWQGGNDDGTVRSSSPPSIITSTFQPSKLDPRIRAKSYDIPPQQLTISTNSRRSENATLNESMSRNKSLTDLKRATTTPVVRESQLYRASHFQADLIVSLSAGATQTILALGLTQRLAGVTDDCDIPEHLGDQIQIIAWSGSEKYSQPSKQSSDHYVDIALIENMWPGTVIVDGKYQDVLNQLFRMTRTVKVQLDVRTFTGMLESIVQLGEILGVPDGAKYLVESLQARLRRVARKVFGVNKFSRVVVVQGACPLRIGSQLVDELIHYAGGVNAWTRMGLEEAQAQWEHILNCDPEVIVLASRNGFQDSVQLAGSPGWWNIQAVKRGKVYLCDYQMFELGGPGLVRGVETLAGILHPQVMSDDKFFDPETVFKMSLKDGQRCRHRMIPNFFRRMSEQC